jgi:tetratricopeptide (TPR) repeat protein
MNRENLLFSIIGVLFGYVVAFTFVVYFNQDANAPRLTSTAGGAAATATGGAASLPTNEVKERQRLQTAAQQAAQTAREDPKNFDAQRAAAEASLEAQDFEGAIDFLTRANQLRPDDYKTLVRLGHANSAAGRFDTAERWFRAALAKQPDDGDVRSELALTFFMRDPPQPERAVAELRRGLEQNPGHVPTLHNLSLMLMQTRDYEGASATLDRLEKVEPSYERLPALRAELEKSRQQKLTNPPAPTGGEGPPPPPQKPPAG